MVVENTYEASSLKDESGQVPLFERKSLDCKNLSKRFFEKSRDFSRQFFQVYADRLRDLRGVLVENACKKWGEDVAIRKLTELENFENERCVIIGTLFKHQFWKPSILRELNEETEDSGVIVDKREDYCSENDVAFLEDEMLRIKIVGENIDLCEIITGIVVALVGKKLEDGTFDVEDWCYPGCVPKNSISQPTGPITNGKILLISGLDLANNENSLSRDLLIETITGMAGTLTDQEDISAIVNVIIAGNSIKSNRGSHDWHTAAKNLITARGQSSSEVLEISEAIKKLDEFLHQIVEHCTVTLMPGQHDPTNVMIPQKPIHPLVLPNSHKCTNLKSVSNPWIGATGGRLIVGTSGQPIEDIMRVCGVSKNEKTPLDWLQKTLEWRHYCPTAPDTLPSYPYDKNDCLIMQECPDIYFVGNTSKFETSLYKGQDGQQVRLICIPEFSTTSTAVLVDIKTLETHPITFGLFQP